jgi:NADPH:quinone reductase-like Zn-dependent oxidoreductase
LNSEKEDSLQAVVVFNPNRKNKSKFLKMGEIALEGVPIGVGLVETSPVVFDPALIENRNRLLIEVLAFSCNYRDRAIILGHFHTDNTGTPLHIGSDFVGVVKEIGRNVKAFMPGDRVIGNNSYPTASAHEALPGVPTNGASASFLILHESKLAKVPDSMPLPVAAGFSIAAQTCYSMIRKLSIRGGERCIVTGASSHTSLFALAMLARMGVRTYPVTTGTRDFGALGVAGTIRVKAPIDQSMITNEVARQLIREHGGANIVIDCFADIYASSVVPLLRQGGTYITCGIVAQRGTEPRFALSSTAWRDLLTFLITNNIRVYGNCLGDESDLVHAIANYADGTSPIPIDCVLGIENCVEFVNRSFAVSNRFGKVVLRYH